MRHISATLRLSVVPPSTVRQMVVLCVARHLYLAQHLARVLAQAGAATRSAVGFDDARRVAADCSPDVVAADYDLLAFGAKIARRKGWPLGRAMLIHRQWPPTPPDLPRPNAPPRMPTPRTPIAAPAPTGGNVKIASMNVLNYFPTTGADFVASGGKCTWYDDRAGEQLVRALRRDARQPSAVDGAAVPLDTATAWKALCEGGSWPSARKTSKAIYTPPAGFIEVTQAEQNTFLSDHIRLRDFFPHDQANVWPKYIVVQMKLVDKLELVLTDLEQHGIPAKGIRVLSGFRTPQYNRGGGDPTGRASLSRHMYGDAADIFIDNDGNGSMDDLNHDGKVNLNDARVILAAVNRVEAAHPSLIGGCGVYPGTSAHGPFTHIDTRGYPARWIGTGDN